MYRFHYTCRRRLFLLVRWPSQNELIHLMAVPFKWNGYENETLDLLLLIYFEKWFVILNVQWLQVQSGNVFTVLQNWSSNWRRRQQGNVTYSASSHSFDLQWPLLARACRLIVRMLFTERFGFPYIYLLWWESSHWYYIYFYGMRTTISHNDIMSCCIRIKALSVGLNGGRSN